MQIENEADCKQIPLPISNCGYALLHEILKDCSSSLDIENKQNTPEIVNYPEQRINTTTDLTCGIQKNTGATNVFNSKERNMEDTPTANNPIQLLKNGTDLDYTTQENQESKPSTVNDSGNINKNIISFKNSHVDNKCNNRSQINLKDDKCDALEVNEVNDNCVTSREGISNLMIDRNMNTINSITERGTKTGYSNHIVDTCRKYNYTKTLSLDERLSKLRQNFVNSENQWLYQSKENNSSSDITLKNAGKVLREAQATSKQLENIDVFNDKKDMFNYFDANSYLVEPDVLRIKKNVDENIKKMNINIQKKVNEKKVNEKKVNEKKVNEKKVNEKKVNEKKVNEKKVNEKKVNVLQNYKRLPLKEQNNIQSKFR